MRFDTDGIRLFKRSDSNERAFIPWARIQSITVQEPRRLAKCRSLADRQKLAASLVAELTISRGDFPAFSIAVPWREDFQSALPRRVELNQSWQWPTISDVVYH